MSYGAFRGMHDNLHINFVGFQVIWEVIGPYPGQEMTDISPTGGVLVFQNGQR